MAHGEPLYESTDSLSDVDLPVCVEMELQGQQVIWRAACHDEIFSLHDTKDLLRRVDVARQHLMQQTDRNVFSKSGEAIFIGDLPSFTVENTSLHVNGYDHSGTEEDGDLEDIPAAGIVLDVIAKVAQVSANEIGPNTTLYHLGLDSISAIKVCSLLKKQNLFISVSNLLRADDVHSIAKAVTDVRQSQPKGATTPDNDSVTVSYTHLTLPTKRIV